MNFILKKKKTVYIVYCYPHLEHVTGIEPAYSAWEANVLPLNYTCMLNFYTTINW